VLAALAEGLSVPEIADDWGVSPTVVYRNVERARMKLGARTTPQACAIWTSRQLAQAPRTNGHSNGVTAHAE
jgi:DNA-binding CsgD family transcriptional regulator